MPNSSSRDSIATRDLRAAVTVSHPVTWSPRHLVAMSMLLWFAVVVIIDFRFLIGSPKQTVYPTFARAGADWRAARDLYQHTEALFRYSPLVAAFFVPFSQLPNWLGEVLWRLLNVGVYLAAMLWWAQTSLPTLLSRAQMAALSLLALPLSIGSINNGQS